MISWLFGTLAGKIVSGMVLTGVVGLVTYIWKKYRDWKLTRAENRVKTLEYEKSLEILEKEAQKKVDEAPADSKSVLDELDKP